MKRILRIAALGNALIVLALLAGAPGIARAQSSYLYSYVCNSGDSCFSDFSGLGPVSGSDAIGGICASPSGLVDAAGYVAGAIENADYEATVTEYENGAGVEAVAFTYDYYTGDQAGSSSSAGCNGSTYSDGYDGTYDDSSANSDSYYS